MRLSRLGLDSRSPLDLGMSRWKGVSLKKALPFFLFCRGDPIASMEWVDGDPYEYSYGNLVFL